MDFGLTPDQELLRETARNLLANECPTALVRAHIDDPTVADALWGHLRDFVALSGGPTVDLCVFVEETGYVAAPGPLFATAALFAPLLEAVGHERAAAARSGALVGTVALAGSDGVWRPNVDPVKRWVPEVDRGDLVAVITDRPALALVTAPAARHVLTIDTSRRLFDVDAAGVVGTDRVDPGALRRVIERATVALAAEMVGTARRLFDMTLRYAKERYQFDVPIGSFQAIQHKLADMSLDVERARSAVYYAAMTFDAADEDRTRATHVAKAAAGEAAKRCAKDGIQIHGGIGYTWEHDLHLFIRRAYASEALLGTTGWHHDRLGDLLLA